ncbi:MAG TPA: 4'-phosphopantetheinyl transferase superfamily protein [Bacteroidia bacterium]|jgi:4'-phosphopantetheinyl transferase|nr:4'-phosphopantetheinyl transferase superfamily protein [Bacteroidia bacterium]
MNLHIPDKKEWFHLWIFDSSNVITNTDAALQFLSEEEIARSKLFLNKADSLRYITAHYFLRVILSKYVEIPPAEIKFSKGINDKPYLKNQLPLPLYFNLSYRDNIFLTGISNCEFIGVDVEKIRNIDDIHSFTANYFSKKEREEIEMQINKQEQLSMLFKFWTMKEAVIKALADGFTKPLPNYDLHSFLNLPISIPNFDNENSWTIQQIKIKSGFKGAFALKAKNIYTETFKYAGH